MQLQTDATPPPTCTPTAPPRLPHGASSRRRFRLLRRKEIPPPSFTSIETGLDIFFNMSKRKQKKEEGSEEKRRAEGTSSSRERADLRGRGLPRPNSSLQVLPYRYRFTGLIMPVSLSLWGSTCKGLVERGHAPNSLSRLLQRLGLGLKGGVTPAGPADLRRSRGRSRAPSTRAS